PRLFGVALPRLRSLRIGREGGQLLLSQAARPPCPASGRPAAAAPADAAAAAGRSAAAAAGALPPRAPGTPAAFPFASGGAALPGEDRRRHRGGALRGGPRRSRREAADRPG